MGRLTLVLLVTLAAVSLRAQNPPTFKTGPNYVRVDMYATQDGRAVTDLKADEVDILEDNVPQKVDAFEHIDIAGDASKHARVFVIFLDTLNAQIETSSNLRVPLVKVIDRVVGQDDMVAVMTPEMSAKDMTFGKKATVISNIMQSDWDWGRRGRLESQDQKDKLYDSCYPSFVSSTTDIASEMKARRREKHALDALDDLVAYIGGQREERKAILTVSAGWVLFRENQSLLSSSSSSGSNTTSIVDKLLRRPTKPKSEETGGPKEVNRVECETDRTALAGLDDSLRLRSLTDEANRSNVTFYSIDPQGIAASTAATAPEKSSSRGREAGAASRQDSLRFIADNTEGLLIANANAIDAGATRIVEDASSYYLIGYTSSNTKLDGRFRTLTVRVKRDGVKVRARRGYRGRTADDLVSSNATGSSGSGEGAALTGPNAGFNARAPFRIRTSSWLRDGSDGGRQGAFWVVGELDYQTRRQLAWTAGAEAEIVVLGADGAEVVSRTVKLGADEGPFSIQVPETGNLASGEYAIRVRIRSEADNKIELADTARVILSQGPALGEAVMWRRGPSTGPRYLRTADPRFTRNDRLRLELATVGKQPATARILDRNKNSLSVTPQVSERPDQSDTFKWIVIDAALAPFAAGDYAIEVAQGSEKRVTEFKVVP